MSRSMKKVGGWADKDSCFKKHANKVVRQKEDIPNGMAYKKIVQSYDICDYKELYFSMNEYKNSEELLELVPAYRAFRK